MGRTVPVLLTAAAILVSAAACSGGKSTSTTSTSTTTSSPAASPAASTAATTAPKSAVAMKSAMGSAAAGNGATIFSTNCASCHQANGKGQTGVFPPLAGNSVVTGPSSAVIHIVKDGLSGKITVAGATYNGQMPPWKGTLSNADIAHVVTYIRSSWGNHAPAVTESQVAATK